MPYPTSFLSDGERKGTGYLIEVRLQSLKELPQIQKQHTKERFIRQYVKLIGGVLEWSNQK